MATMIMGYFLRPKHILLIVVLFMVFYVNPVHAFEHSANEIYIRAQVKLCDIEWDYNDGDGIPEVEFLVQPILEGFKLEYQGEGEIKRELEPVFTRVIPKDTKYLQIIVRDKDIRHHDTANILISDLQGIINSYHNCVDKRLHQECSYLRHLEFRKGLNCYSYVTFTFHSYNEIREKELQNLATFLNNLYDQYLGKLNKKYRLKPKHFTNYERAYCKAIKFEECSQEYKHLLETQLQLKAAFDALLDMRDRLTRLKKDLLDLDPTELLSDSKSIAIANEMAKNLTIIDRHLDVDRSEILKGILLRIYNKAKKFSRTNPYSHFHSDIAEAIIEVVDFLNSDYGKREIGNQINIIFTSLKTAPPS